MMLNKTKQEANTQVINSFLEARFICLNNVVKIKNICTELQIKCGTITKKDKTVYRNKDVDTPTWAGEPL